MASQTVQSFGENATLVPAGKVFGAAAVEPARRAPLGNIGNISNMVNKLAPGKKEEPADDASTLKPARKGLSLKASVTSAAGRVLGLKRVRKGSLSQPLTANKRLSVHGDAAPMEVHSEDEEEYASTQVAAQPVVLPEGVEDIDAEDADNPLLVADYVNEIYAYMRDLELRYQVSENYLQIQTEVNAKMRSILVDWLVDVHLRFELLQETLFLTINTMDRYLAKVPVARAKLQLVAVTAMLVSAKYEEMYPPEVRDFIYICDNAYSREEILKMEQHMLATLDFSLGQPLCLHFLRRYSKAGKSDARIHTIAKYLMELTLGSQHMLRYVPSQIAAAAIYLARSITAEPTVWDANLQFFSGYAVEHISPCIEHLAALLRDTKTSQLMAIKNKYARSKFMKISALPEVEGYVFQGC